MQNNGSIDIIRVKVKGVERWNTKRQNKREEEGSRINYRRGRRQRRKPDEGGGEEAG